MEDANLSSLVPGLILIHKTILLTRICNSSQYNMDECTCRKERIHCKRGLLTQSLSKSPETQELQFLLKLSSIDEVPRSPGISGMKKESWADFSTLFFSIGSEHALPHWQGSGFLKPTCLPCCSWGYCWCHIYKQVAGGSGCNLPAEALLLYSLSS